MSDESRHFSLLDSSNQLKKQKGQQLLLMMESESISPSSNFLKERQLIQDSGGGRELFEKRKKFNNYKSLLRQLFRKVSPKLKCVKHHNLSGIRNNEELKNALKTERVYTKRGKQKKNQYSKRKRKGKIPKQEVQQIAKWMEDEEQLRNFAKFYFNRKKDRAPYGSKKKAKEQNQDQIPKRITRSFPANTRKTMMEILQNIGKQKSKKIEKRKIITKKKQTMVESQSQSQSQLLKQLIKIKKLFTQAATNFQTEQTQAKNISSMETMKMVVPYILDESLISDHMKNDDQKFI